MVAITVEATLDTVCPYCYLGKRNMEKAIETYRAVHPEDEFEVSYKPFYLNPTARKAGYAHMEVYERKFGDRAGDFIAHITELGAEHDIVFDLSGRTGSSRDSHKLIALAGRKSPPPAPMQARLVERLLRGQHVEAEDISDRAFLLRAAAQAGLDPAEAAAWLDEEAAGEEVDRQARAAVEERRVRAVPVFTIQGRYVIGGLQGPEVFLPVFEKAREGTVTGAA